MTPFHPELVVETVSPPEPPALAAAREVLEALMAQAHTDTWIVARVSDDRYTVLVGEGAFAQQGPPRTDVAYEDTVCSRMVAGLGPTVAPRIVDVPAYAAAPVVAANHLASYAGVPIEVHGQVIAVLCGFAAEELTMTRRAEHQLVSSMRSKADDLGHAFEEQFEAHDVDRQLDVIDATRSADRLTHLPDRRGWGLLLAREERRAADFAESVGVAVVDVGHALTARAIRRATSALLSEAGADAYVTRVDGRRFAVLLPDRTTDEVDDFVHAAGAAIARKGVAPLTGWTMRRPGDGLEGAWLRATENLFELRREATGRPCLSRCRSGPCHSTGPRPRQRTSGWYALHCLPWPWSR